MNDNFIDIPIGEERKINNYQRRMYGEHEDNGKTIIDIHRKAIDELLSKKDCLEILDIGGGCGYFAAEIYKYCQSKECNVQCTILDTTSYDTWKEEELSYLNFVEGSAFNITKIFAPHSFDCVFCNRLMHHLVFGKLKQTLQGQALFLNNVKYILKPDGVVFVTENTIESYVGNWSNKLHFYLTSIKNPVISTVFRVFGAKSAGTGTYFRSKEGWKQLFEECGFKVVNQTPEESRAKFIGFKQKMAKMLMLIDEHLINVGYVLIVNG